MISILEKMPIDNIHEEYFKEQLKSIGQEIMGINEEIYKLKRLLKFHEERISILNEAIEIHEQVY